MPTVTLNCGSETFHDETGAQGRFARFDDFRSFRNFLNGLNELNVLNGDFLHESGKFHGTEVKLTCGIWN